MSTDKEKKKIIIGEQGDSPVVLSYNHNDECIYDGDCSIDSFMTNALLCKIDDFFCFEEWFAFRFGLNEKQKKGIKKLQECFILGKFDFDLLFKDYDLVNLPKEASIFIGHALHEVGYVGKNFDYEMDLALHPFMIKNKIELT